MSFDRWVNKENVAYKVCSEGIQPCNMKNRDLYWRRYKIQETWYIGQWHLSPLQSRHLRISHSSPNRHQLPCCYFPESHQWSEISSLSKMILVLGQARSHRVPNQGCMGAESPGWFGAKKALYKMWYISRHIVTMKLPKMSYPWLWPSESSK